MKFSDLDILWYLTHTISCHTEEGPAFDYTIQSRLAIVSGGGVETIGVTFTVDNIAQEPEETFSLTLELIGGTPTALNVANAFFEDVKNLTIQDRTGKTDFLV